jgi:hypothetical protein
MRHGASMPFEVDGEADVPLRAKVEAEVHILESSSEFSMVSE